MNTKPLIPAATIRPENLSFYQITNGAYFFGLFGHVAATIVFWAGGLSEMILFNLCFSIPAFLVALFANRRGKHSLAFFFAFMELLLHQVFATYFLGWGFGAHYLLIYLAGLCFFNNRWNSGIRYGLLFLVSTVYILMYLLWQEGIVLHDPATDRIANIAQGLITLVALSLLINHYATTTHRAEKKLTREQANTRTMLTKVEALFGQQISEEIAQEMIASDREIVAKNYDATIMFLDIRDFTLFADSRNPKEVARFQNTVFGALIQTITEHQGVVLQLLGDGLMAVFGAPNAHPNHASNAVKSGYAMLEQIKVLVAEGQIPPIRLGIGLNSGNIIAGNIGNDRRKAYSLTGMNVIIAARIEPLNKKYKSQFLISGSVLDAIGPQALQQEDLGEVNLKGIEQSIRIHKLA